MSAYVTKAVPQLPAADFDTARNFYVNKLHFILSGAYDNILVFIRDEIELHIWKCADVQVAEQSGCYFYVADVDAFYQQYRHLPCVVCRPQDNGRGVREFSLLDDSGNLLYFGQRLQQ